MQTNRCGIFIACLILLLACGAAAQRGQQRTVAVIAQPPRQHIPDFHLTDILCDAFLMYGDLNVAYPGNETVVPPVPDSRFDLKRLIDWGREVGVRYIVYLQVNSRQIVREKSVSIPFILSRYVIEGRIDGTYILVDVQFGKTLATFNLDTSLSGPQQWQVIDDNCDDPALHIPAPEKVTFFQTLERQAAAEILAKVTPHMRGR